MMVMMMAITPSLNASSLPLFMEAPSSIDYRRGQLYRQYAKGRGRRKRRTTPLEPKGGLTGLPGPLGDLPAPTRASPAQGGVRQLNKAVLVRDHVLQIPLLLSQRTAEQPQSVTQQDRSYGQPDFVHQSEFEEALGQHGPAYEPYISIPRCEFIVNECLEIP